MKEFFYGILTFLLVFCLCYLFSDSCINFQKMAEKSLGKEVIVNKDTLIIVNYNVWDQTLILSNGIKVRGIMLKEQLYEENSN